MVYKLLADGVVLVHFTWILFLFVGAFWGRRHRFVKIFHISGLCLALVLEALGWICPLTYVEVALRSKHDPSPVYAGTFIIHTIEALIYLELSRKVVFFLTFLLVGGNLWFYAKQRKICVPHH